MRAIQDKPTAWPPWMTGSRPVMVRRATIFLTLSLSKGEECSPQAKEMVRWTISNDERRALGRAAG
jgi:hypothetical protein